jgi:ribosomal protein S21
MLYVKIMGTSDDDLQRAIKIFNKKVKDSGLMKEIYDRREFVKPSLKKRLQKKEAVKRRMREERQQMNNY